MKDAGYIAQNPAQSKLGLWSHCLVGATSFYKIKINFVFFPWLNGICMISTQGEVEQISLMKPKAQGPHDEGFLEYLEDIIGTNQYVEKIEEAYKQ